ncbi:MAG: DUF4010 domain-containing protein [Bacteroidetes bacterium]|nr:MAG: DUF4010 domain-containing protein [Bacteroidota bacterium]
MNFINEIPRDLLNGMVIIVLSLLIGIEQRKHYADKPENEAFGSDRTFTLIGILGFILYLISPANLLIFWSGAFILSLFLGIYYWQKVKVFNDYGITTILIALITYCLTPLVYTQPGWMVLLIVVAVLILVEVKSRLTAFTAKIDMNEFFTLSKFIILAGIILPLLPSEKILSFLDITPKSIWLSVVVISGISYISYLLNKFVIKKGGITITGILGGIYSSTATTIILSRKSREANGSSEQYARGIILATGAMYLRILALVFIFNFELAIHLTPYILFLSLVSLLTGFLFTKSKYKRAATATGIDYRDRNPLELKFAFLFASLFIVFSIITYFTIQNFGNSGLTILSIVIGVTDIDPFLLNLFQGKYEVTSAIIGAASLQAIASNNLIKLFYTYFLADRKVFWICLKAFLIIIIMNIIAVLLLYYLF